MHGIVGNNLLKVISKDDLNKYRYEKFRASSHYLAAKVHGKPEPGSKKRRFARMLGSGGAKRVRTDDLYNAIVALSQLSYSPTRLETDPVLAVNSGFVEAYFS